MSEASSLVIFTKAEMMLAEANTIQETKEFIGLALTAVEWAKRKNLGEAAIRHAQSYAARAEIKLGELLLATERATGGRPMETSSHREPVIEARALSSFGGAQAEPSKNDVPTLSSLGITKKESSKAQALARMPEERKAAFVSGKKSKTRVLREQRREEVVQKVAMMPSEKYRVVYADPPWKYGDTRDGLENTTGASAHYPCMTIEELCALPINSIVEENSVLFLWVTSPMLVSSVAVINAWGFKYKTSFVWDKVKHNIGHYNSVRHEFLMVCTRGSCVPDVNKLFDSVQTIERSDRHSEKPEEFRAIIDTIYPHGKRIELFARVSPPAPWDAYGNE